MEPVIPPVSPPAVSTSSPSSTKKLPIIIAGLVLLFLVAGGSYLLGQKTVKVASKVSISPIPSPLPMHAIIEKGYYNKELGISLTYPSDWTVKDDKGQLAETVIFQGKEGQVSLAWGTGFGGGCPPEQHEKITINNETKDICHGSDSNNGSEYWSQIYWQRDTKTISLGAQANSPSSQNAQKILQILSTFKLLDQNQTRSELSTKTYTNDKAGFSVDYPSDAQLIPISDGNGIQYEEDFLIDRTKVSIFFSQAGFGGGPCSKPLETFGIFDMCRVNESGQDFWNSVSGNARVVSHNGLNFKITATSSELTGGGAVVDMLNSFRFTP